MQENLAKNTIVKIGKTMMIQNAKDLNRHELNRLKNRIYRLQKRENVDLQLLSELQNKVLILENRQELLANLVNW